MCHSSMVNRIGPGGTGLKRLLAGVAGEPRLKQQFRGMCPERIKGKKTNGHFNRCS